MKWFYIAWRNLWRAKRRSLLTGGTAAVGTFAIILAIGFVVASLAGIRDATIRGGVGHVHLGQADAFDGYAERPLQYGLAPEEQERMERVLRDDPRVRLLLPRVLFSGLISNGEQTLTFVGSGVEARPERSAFGAFTQIVEGSSLATAVRDGKTYSTLLGSELAHRLGAEPGSFVTVLSVTESGAINAIDLEVVGITRSGTPELDLRYLQIPLAAAQDLLRSSKISRYVLLLTGNELTDAVAADWNGDGLEARKWTDIAPTYGQVARLYRDQFTVLGVIIVIVVFLTLTNTVLMNVMERAREIGTMRALGIPKGIVRSCFLIEGISIGGIGAIVGSLLALALTVIIEEGGVMMPPPPGRSVGYPLRIAWELPTVLAVIAGIIVVSAAASWLASRRATKLDIVKALGST